MPCGAQVQAQAAAQARLINTQQLRQILARGQLPDGRVLTEQMRNVLIQKISGNQGAMQRGEEGGGPLQACHAQAFASQPLVTMALFCQLNMQIWLL